MKIHMTPPPQTNLQEGFQQLTLPVVQPEMFLGQIPKQSQTETELKHKVIAYIHTLGENSIIIVICQRCQTSRTVVACKGLTIKFGTFHAQAMAEYPPTPPKTFSKSCADKPAA